MKAQKVVLLRAGRRLRPLLLGTRVAPGAATLRAAPRLRSGMIFMCTLTALETIYGYNRERLCSEIQMFCVVAVGGNRLAKAVLRASAAGRSRRMAEATAAAPDTMFPEQAAFGEKRPHRF